MDRAQHRRATIGYSSRSVATPVSCTVCRNKREGGQDIVRRDVQCPGPNLLLGHYLDLVHQPSKKVRHLPNVHATIRHTPVGIFRSVQIIFVFGKISMLDRALTTALRRPPIPLFTSFFSTTSSCYAKKMAPKKVVAEKKTLLGRPGNNLKIGIVGLVCSLRIFVFSSPDLLLSFKACRT